MSGTTAYKGRDGLLAVSTNGGSTFTTVGGVRTNGMTLNNEAVDITNAGSSGFKELLPDGGVQSVGLSVDGVVVDNTAWEAMGTQAKDRTLVYYKLTFANGGVVQGRFAINSFAINSSYNGAQEFSAQMESSGSVTLTMPS